MTRKFARIDGKSVKFLVLAVLGGELEGNAIHLGILRIGHTNFTLLSHDLLYTCNTVTLQHTHTLCC